ncbi:SMP-30/Gluconolactonase/LRE-like region [Popillia japonica]|uniref:SMP-30/Gluconolactonase/LRE-like region n=1 Tax=Popillia japonica TaxID=7064 RepID=A0AAW1IA12_POPJA
MSFTITLGESPFWDAETQILYFLDVHDQYIIKYTPATNSYVKAHVPIKGSLGSITPIEGRQNEFLIGASRGIARIKWDGISNKIKKLDIFAELPETNPKYMRLFNNARVDYSGQLWIGCFVMNPFTGVLHVFQNAGGLFKVQPNRSLTQYVDGLTMPSGFDWNKKQNKFYFVNTFPGEILEFDYNPNTTELSNKKICFTFENNSVDGAPAGMAIDERDNLWIACFHGGKIVNINPRIPNTIIRTIDMPVNASSAVAFGGPELDQLYVTTPSSSGVHNPMGGGRVYKITGLGVRGYPGRKFKL